MNSIGIHKVILISDKIDQIFINDEETIFAFAAGSRTHEEVILPEFSRVFM